jgi:hypothetical protein
MACCTRKDAFLKPRMGDQCRAPPHVHKSASVRTSWAAVLARKATKLEKTDAQRNDAMTIKGLTVGNPIIRFDLGY